MAIRVLIVDSSGISREIIRHHLECMGCEVIAEAETASQAINLFRTVQPQVVTLDVGLKPTGALDVLSVFRTVRSEAPETLVMMTGTSWEPETSRVFLSEGAIDCIVERFDSAGFEQMWRSLSGRYPELRRVEPPAGLPAARSSRGHRC
jgi:two-component system, chemotaxis family, chemotaxis protein CheY